MCHGPKWLETSDVNTVMAGMLIPVPATSPQTNYWTLGEGRGGGETAVVKTAQTGFFSISATEKNSDRRIFYRLFAEDPNMGTSYTETEF